MAKQVFIIGAEHNTPTEVLLDRVVQKLAGQTVYIAIAKLRIKDSSGNILGEAVVTPTAWESYKLTKDVTISTAGQAAYFSLDAADGAELYKYQLDSPLSLNAGDTVHIEWTLKSVCGENMNQVGNKILDVIIGAETDIKIAQILFVEAGSVQYNATPSAVNADTENNKVVVETTVTPTSDISYDSIQLLNAAGDLLFEISTAGTLSANVQTTVTIEVSVTTQ